MLTHPSRLALTLSTLTLSVACALAYDGGDDEPTELRSSCWGPTCCPTGTIAVTGTASDDTLSAATTSECLQGLQGNDELYLTVGGIALAGPGDDVVQGSPGAESLFGHDGDDVITAYGGPDEIWPGPGMDTVLAGYGHDVIVVNALCEVEPGESLGGGPGTDTIRSPFTQEELTAAGAQLPSIETFERVPRDIGKAECCDADACGEHGTCMEDQGAVSCACEPGYTGRTCAFETAKVLPEFLGVADPTAWSFDPLANRHYRRATELELETNGWQPGTFLVTLGGLDEAFAEAEASTTVTLPMTDGTTMQLVLDLRATDDTRKFVSMDGSRVDATSGGPVIEGLRPTINLYGSQTTELATGTDLHGIVATAVTVQELGQFDIQGVAERTGANGPSADAVAVSNSSPDWYVENIPGPSVGPSDLYLVSWTEEETLAQWPPNEPSDVCAMWIPAPPNTQGWHPCNVLEPDPPGDCGDGIDNDDDGHVDGKEHPDDADYDSICEHQAGCDPATPGKSYPPHTHVTELGKHFGLFGDVVWCTRHEANWVAKLYQLGRNSEQVFSTHPGEDGGRSATYDTAIDHGQVPLRFSVGKCWIVEDYDDAEACQLEGGASCSPFDEGSNSGHVYPYAGLGALLDKNEDLGWDSTLSDYFTAVTQDLAHAAQLPAPHNIDYPLDFMQVVLRPAHVNDWSAGGITYTCQRKSIIHDDSSVDSPKLVVAERSAHELAHDFSCLHKHARILDAPGLPGWSMIWSSDPGDDETWNAYDDEHDRPGNENVGDYRVNRLGDTCANRVALRFNRHSPPDDDSCEVFGDWGPTFGY